MKYISKEKILEKKLKSYKIVKTSTYTNIGNKHLSVIIEGFSGTIFLSDNRLKDWLEYGLQHIFSERKNRLRLGWLYE